MLRQAASGQGPSDPAGAMGKRFLVWLMSSQQPKKTVTSAPAALGTMSLISYVESRTCAVMESAPGCPTTVSTLAEAKNGMLATSPPATPSNGTVPGPGGVRLYTVFGSNSRPVAATLNPRKNALTRCAVVVVAR